MGNNREFVIESISKYKIIAILRKIAHKDLLPLVEAMYAGGIRLIEVTFDQESDTCFEDSCNAISTLSSEFHGRMLVGAGTVVSTAQVDAAANAGALFIISPNTDIDVIKHTRELELVSLPGALTPTEIVAAHSAGADFVKIFPSGGLGSNYISSVRAPLPHIPMLAVGGVNLDNITDFLKAGVSGVGLGANIARPDLIESGKFDEITNISRAYTELAERFN